MVEKSSEAASFTMDQAHKASEYVQHKAAENGTNGHHHEGETEEEKKREEAHKEAHEKAAEEGK